jgi:hypothetical protein
MQGFYGIKRALAGILVRLTAIENTASSGTATNLTVSGILTTQGEIKAAKTITAAATVGAQTINKPAGSVNFAAAATSLVVTNSLVTTSSVILVSTATNDADASKLSVVAGSGSFTIRFGIAVAAETRVNFLVIN